MMKTKGSTVALCLSCLFAVLSFAGSSSALAGGSLVGNGGGGILDNGKIHVLDLYEAGTAKAPFIEKTSDEDRDLVFRKWNPEVDFDHRLLAQKLDELNHRFTNLGNFVADAFDFFEVTFADDPLTLLCDEEAPCRPGQVQLAIRRFRSIYLDRQLWRQLDAEQKIALLIHEGIYSYARVECDQTKMCRQISREIRPIVGQLFSPNRDKDHELLSLILQRLDIKELHIPRSYFSVSFWWPSMFAGRPSPQPLQWEGTAGSLEFEKKIEDYCLHSGNAQGKQFWLMLNREKSFRSVSPVEFSALYGNQWAFRGFIHEMYSSRMFTNTDCKTISQDMTNWSKHWPTWL